VAPRTINNQRQAEDDRCENNAYDPKRRRLEYFKKIDRLNNIKRPDQGNCSKDNEEDDSLEYYFPIGSSSARFMEFKHNYNLASPEFQNQLKGDTALGSQQFYLQSLAGVATIIEIPYLRNLNNLGGIALNEAKLTIPDNNPDDELIPPSELILYAINGEGQNTLVIDQLEGTEYFGGIYEESPGRVIFRITQQLQRSLANDTIPLKFYLGVSGASILPNRMVCKGNSPFDGSQGLKLELIYTNLNN